MGVFYTKKGDKGYSHVGKKKVYKLNPFVAALGQLDQLNSLLGVARTLPGRPANKDLNKVLLQVQQDLFVVQANIAYAMLKEKRQPPFFSPVKTEAVEKIIDGIEKRLKPVRKFVISGAGHRSAWLDYIRAFSRSVERSVLLAAKGKKGKFAINPDILPYLNRLSSLFFALARREAVGKKEMHPDYK